MKRRLLTAGCILIGYLLFGQKFEQLGTLLPTPNTYRTASGAPGHLYWQQRADHKIKVKLDDDALWLSGQEEIIYYNQSPDELSYLWLQIDQNLRSPQSDTYSSYATTLDDSIDYSTYYMSTKGMDFDGGYQIDWVKDLEGKPLKYFINKTMMRVDLPAKLQSGKSFSFQVSWGYRLNDRMKDNGRSGYEYFPKDDNRNYTIAQFFPRMAVYIDNEGWQNKQFLGDGEFALTFGNYEVEITVPADFIVGATGTLVNEAEVLTSEQLRRLKQARSNEDEVTFIVTEKEARENEKSRSKDTKTWKYSAQDVRDFAFAASRKYIWDAMTVDINGKKPLAMSLYGKEGNPLWEKYSTRVVAHTLKEYSKRTIDYPYPVAISVHAANLGMEYPMICFNFGRPTESGYYSDYIKGRMIGVIIHEVGHNFFPMIVNSDERQWAWMDEGLNSFIEYLTEQAWDPEFPSRRGPPELLIDYLGQGKELTRPIMTNPEQILQLGNNAYGKPAVALNILREVVMGPELFDYAFKTYAERWAFKHPTPADFFRTMEDASAVDLDWFWRGWFYTTDYVDVSIDRINWYRFDIKAEKPERTSIQSEDPVDHQGLTKPKKLNVSMNAPYSEFRNGYDSKEMEEEMGDKNYYEVTFGNNGGLVTPLLLKWTYKDGTVESEKIPAEIWRKNEDQVTKVFIKSKEVVSLELDPDRLTSDANKYDNIFPRKTNLSRFDRFKSNK